MPQYKATFSAERLYGLPNLWVECESIRLESNIGFAFTGDICRALKEAGHADGSIVFFKNGRTEPSWQFPSVYEIADRMTTVMPLNAALYQALSQIDTGDWIGVQGRVRSLLLDQGFVMIEGDGPVITDLARTAMVDFLAQPEVAPTVSVKSLTSYPDITTASQADMIRAAEIIGLNVNGHNVERVLRFIETTIAQRSLDDVENMARRADVPVRGAGRGSETMKKRRLLAHIMNAGKIAQAL